MEGGDRVSRASQWPWRARLTWRPASPARPRAALRVALRPLPRQASDDPPGPRATPPALLRPPPSGSRAAPQPCLTPPRVPFALIPHRPGTLPPASLWAGLPWKTHLLSSGSWGLPAHRGGGAPPRPPTELLADLRPGVNAEPQSLQQACTRDAGAPQAPGNPRGTGRGGDGRLGGAWSPRIAAGPCQPLPTRLPTTLRPYSLCVPGGTRPRPALSLSPPTTPDTGPSQLHQPEPQRGAWSAGESAGRLLSLRPAGHSPEGGYRPRVCLPIWTGVELLRCVDPQRHHQELGRCDVLSLLRSRQ